MEPTQETTQKELSAAAKLYLRGWSLRRIAAYLCVSHTTIAAVLDSEGIPRRRGTELRGKNVTMQDGQVIGNFTVLHRAGNTYPPRWVTQCNLCKREFIFSRWQLMQNRTCGCGRKGRKADEE